MSFASTVKSWFTGEEAKVERALEHGETDLKDVEHGVAPVIEAEKQVLRGAVLQALTEAKSALKNSESGISDDAEKAVDSVIQAAIQAMIKDAL